MINNRVSEMKNKNMSTFEKLQEYKEKYEKQYEEKCKSFLLKELKDVDRIKKIEKSIDSFK